MYLFFIFVAMFVSILLCSLIIILLVVSYNNSLIINILLLFCRAFASVSYVAFLVLEVAVGMYFPTIGFLRSQVGVFWTFLRV